MDSLDMDVNIAPNEAKNFFVVKIKFAVSKEEAEDKNTLKSLLRRLRQLVEKEFSDQLIFYQLNAKFQLINITTKEIRQFSGNIYPNSCESMNMQSRIFCRFENESSILHISKMMTEDRARTILSRFNTDMQWAFFGVTTFVISMHMNLKPGHPFLNFVEEEKKEDTGTHQMDVDMDTLIRDGAAAAAAAVVVAAAAAAAASTAVVSSSSSAALEYRKWRRRRKKTIFWVLLWSCLTMEVPEKRFP